MSKKDRNNFIRLVLQKIALVKTFHQRVAMSITRKVFLNCFEAKFYLRKRYDKVFLYTRIKYVKSGKVTNLHTCILDLYRCLKNATLESTQGHLNGIVINTNNMDDIATLLKLIAILSSPKDFVMKDTKVYKCIYNKLKSSDIPIHFRITQTLFLDFRNYDICALLTNGIEKYVKKTTIIDDDKFNNTITSTGNNTAGDGYSI